MAFFNPFVWAPSYIIHFFQSYPVNMFPDPSIKGFYSPSWLYANLAEIYQQWLPTDSQQKMVKDGGYFSVSEDQFF